MNEVSIFHEYGTLEKIGPPESKVEAFHDKLENGLYEYGIVILNALYKYRIINKKNLEKYLNTKKSSSWKLNMLPKMLKMLRKANLIEALGIRKDNESDYHIVLYRITESGAKKIEKEFMEEFTNMSNKELLKRASLNQWHIGILRNYNEKVKEHKYYNFYIPDGKPVPSVITIKTKNRGTPKGQVSIFTYPAPREAAEIQPFFKEMLKLHSALLQEMRYRPAVIIALCENEAHASWIAWHTNKYRQTRPFYILYSQDLITDTEIALENLLSCDLNEEGIIHASVDLT